MQACGPGTVPRPAVPRREHPLSRTSSCSLIFVNRSTASAVQPRTHDPLLVALPTTVRSRLSRSKSRTRADSTSSMRTRYATAWTRYCVSFAYT